MSSGTFKRVLQCHSKGDTRFSPFFCWVEAFGVRDSIEEHYQKAKVFRRPDGELVWPANWREAKRLENELTLHNEFRLPNGLFAPKKYHIYGWYSSLWLKYLDLHPELVSEASRYDEYVDIFKYGFPLCQADCIRLYCKRGRAALLDTCKDFFAWLRENKN